MNNYKHYIIRVRRSLFYLYKRPINVFGYSSNNSENKVDTSLIVQKTFLRSNYIESDLDHDIKIKNQYRIINLPDPINDKDGINKINIVTKFADIIKRNNQNDDYIAFLDNDNVEYKLAKYTPKITLTNESLLNAVSGSDCNSLWGYYTQTEFITNVISGRNTITPLSWRTGPGILYEELPYISFQSHFLTSNTYAEISRFDIHNIIKIQILINRYSLDNIKGEFNILYKNSYDEWIELYKIEENTNITPIDEGDTITLIISENNYDIKIRHDNKNSTNQMCSLSKIVLTHTKKFHNFKCL